MSSAQHTRPPPSRPFRHMAQEVARVAAGERQRRLTVVRLARVRPRAQVVDGAAVVVAVGGVPRVPVALVPHELHRLPVHRHGHRPRVERHRLELLGRAEPVGHGLVHAEAAHAVLRQGVLEPGRVCALRQPEPSAPAAEAAPVRRDAGAQLEPEAGVGGQQRQHGMRGRRGPELHTLEGAERPEEIAAAPLEALGGALVVARRAAHLRREHGLASASSPTESSACTCARTSRRKRR